MSPNNAFLHTYLCTRYTLVISVCAWRWRFGGGGEGAGGGGGCYNGTGLFLQIPQTPSFQFKVPISSVSENIKHGLYSHLSWAGKYNINWRGPEVKMQLQAGLELCGWWVWPGTMWLWVWPATMWLMGVTCNCVAHGCDLQLCGS